MQVKHNKANAYRCRHYWKLKTCIQINNRGNTGPLNVSWSLLLRYKERMGKIKKLQNGKKVCPFSIHGVTSRYSETLENRFIVYYDLDEFPRLGLFSDNKFYKYVRQRNIALIKFNKRDGLMAENIIEACDRAKRIGLDLATKQELIELAMDLLLNGYIKTIVEGMNNIVLE